jgi:hypothetical protein
LADEASGIVAFRQEPWTTPEVPQQGFSSRDNGSFRLCLAGTNSRHIQHWTSDLHTRLAAHAAGRGARDGGARLVQVIREAGIGFEVARTWPEATRATERQLKRRGGARRHCPLCKQQRDHRDQQDTRPTAPAGSDSMRVFLRLNPAFARPAGASQVTQAHRVRGREQVEALGARVTTAWAEENQRTQQARYAAITRRLITARTLPRQHRAANRAERDRRRTFAHRTHQRIQAACTTTRSQHANTRRPRTGTPSQREGQR